ncbi:MAG: hypothetical protein QNJ54_33505 [Prochloraceae cyanobacterium]|nr:hypothetical protein [Prochloraceae cyanobacterium]
MADVAQKVTILVKKFQSEADQLTIDDRTLVLFTHRQSGEIIGKTKATAQKFRQQNAEQLPEPIKAYIPERRRQIPLTPPTAAINQYEYCCKQSSYS